MDQFETERNENQVRANIHSFYEEEEEAAKKQWETYEVESEGGSSQKAATIEECSSTKKEVLEEIQEVNSSPEQIISAPVREAPVEKTSAPVVTRQALAAEPRKMPNVSPFAQGIIAELDSAVAQQDGTELSNQVFDAECEGLEDQIDLAWYEAKAAEFIENS